MIDIQNLSAQAGDVAILDGVSMRFEPGKNYAILGKNGSGKSTLSSVLMGHPSYEVKGGEVMMHNPLPTSPSNQGEEQAVNLLEMEPDERSRAGIFLSFQNIPEIKGVKLSEYLRTIFNIAQTSPQPSESPHPNSLPEGEGTSSKFQGLSPFMFRRYITPILKELHIEEEFLDRDLNVGFSGGEKRKIEILQMKLIGPKYIILDEIDSGLDLDAFKTVATMLQSLSSPENAIIIITHYFTILDYIDVDTVYVMKNGKVVREGGKELADEVKEKGFEGM